MDVSFYKLRLLRNDFILFPNQQSLPQTDDITSILSSMAAKRRIGIGASGVIFLNKVSETGHRISVYDRNGFRRTEILDAFLCASRYLIDSGMTDGSTVIFDNEDKAVQVDVIDSRQLSIHVGVPKEPSTGEEFDDSIASDFTESILLDGRRLPVTPVLLNDPYLVFIPIPAGWKLAELDRRVKSETSLRDFTTIYARPMTPESIRVYCRPVEDPADGVRIASCAAVTAISNGYADGIVLSEYAGDSAFIEWNSKSHVVTATVAPAYVYAGEAHFDIPAFGEDLSKPSE
jgi:hypothetical protein